MLRLLFLLFSFAAFAQSNKYYEKNRGDNNQITSEGWMNEGLKVDYWRTYYDNNNIASEGHFKDGLQENYWYFYRPNGELEKEGHYVKGFFSGWWIFYDISGDVLCKTQYVKGVKEGYSLVYKSNELVKAEKYNSGVKVGEWMDLNSFKAENDLSDLY